MARVRDLANCLRFCVWFAAVLVAFWRSARPAAACVLAASRFGHVRRDDAFLLIDICRLLMRSSLLTTVVDVAIRA